MKRAKNNAYISRDRKLIFENTFYSLQSLLYIILIMGLASCGGNSSDSIHNPVTTQDTKQEQAKPGYTLYQIGPKWDAKKVNAQFLTSRNDFLTSKLALATMKISTPWESGTGFFLGKYNRQYLVATSAHVLKNIPTCVALPVHAIFTLKNRSYSCHSIIGIWNEIDLAIFTIREYRGDEFLKEINPLKFDFNDPYTHGTPLMTMGYGEYKNPDGDLTLKESRDCMIYSPTGELGQVAREDDNSGDNKMIAKKVTAFATGCDISPGDSGSAILNIQSQKVIGLVWATSTPKPNKILTDNYLDSLVRGQQDPSEVWKYFSYGVSAKTIKNRLIDWTNEVHRGGFGLQRRINTVLELVGVY